MPAWAEILATAGSALVGAIIGALATVYATDRALKGAAEAEREERREERRAAQRATLRALREELEANRSLLKAGLVRKAGVHLALFENGFRQALPYFATLPKPLQEKLHDAWRRVTAYNGLANFSTSNPSARRPALRDAIKDAREEAERAIDAVYPSLREELEREGSP